MIDSKKSGAGGTRRQFLERAAGSAFLLASRLVRGAVTPEIKRVTVRMVSIPGRPLPAIVAEKQEWFAKYGLDVQIEVAPTSEALRRALSGASADIAHAAVDNAVAMVEKAAQDVVIVMGGERSINELIAQPGVSSIADLRGRSLLVDAPNTAYALQLRKMLLLAGLEAGRDYELKALGTTPLRLQAMREHKEYAASILGPPFSVMAKHEGFVSLGSTEKPIGPYQATGAFVQRSWAQAHSDALVGYLAAYIEGQRWLLEPRNRDAVVALLKHEWHLAEPAALETYSLLTGGQWFEEDARFDAAGFKTVLQLRTELGQTGTAGTSPRGTSAGAEKYYDASWYRQALSKISSRHS